MREIINLRIRNIITAVIIFFLIPGCASSYQDRTDLSETYRFDVERMLREEVELWTYTPHRMGGKSSSGADCSGFVMIVYEKLFGITLPRDTINQATVGFFIDKKELKPGDLVFFKPPSTRRHVGIYINKGEFAHASSLKGVTLSKIDDPNWKKYYWTSRRISPMIYITAKISIRENEIREEFIQASGPGGQNVNKVASAVQLRFNVKSSSSLPDDVRKRLIIIAGKRLSSEGHLIINARRFRDQNKNREDALGRLVKIIRKAAEVEKPRIKTRPSRKSKIKRLEAKRHRSGIKKIRRPALLTEE